MKFRFALLALLLVSVSLGAQTTPPQTPPAAGQAPAGTALPPRRAHMQQMHQQHMQQMQEEMSKMRALVEKLKTDTTAIPDGPGKQAAQDNADLWQAFLDHMQRMQHMMGGMHGGMGMGPGHGMGMGKGAPPQSQPAPPPKP